MLPKLPDGPLHSIQAIHPAKFNSLDAEFSDQPLDSVSPARLLDDTIDGDGALIWKGRLPCRPAKLPICDRSNMTVSNLGVTDQIKVTGCPEVSNDLRLLEQAFGERLAALGGRAVVLESLVKVIRESGYQGTEQQAASALIGSGRFSVARNPETGHLIVWRIESAER